MQAKYPKAMKVFSDWIDEYKKKNNWKRLFNGGVGIHDNDYPASDTVSITSAPKYHDLPIALQLGIWNEFAETNGGVPTRYQDALTAAIEEYLKTREDW